MQGWIKLYRVTMESPIFDNANLYKVWSYCLMKASHKEHKVMVGNQLVELKPGEFIFGRKRAAIELNMTESSTWRYIKKLENMGNLNINSNNKFSLVNIVNWGKYQDGKTDDEQHLEQQENNKWTTDEQQVDTNKNVKNVKNDNNKESRNSAKAKYADDSPYYKLSVRLFNHLKQRNSEHKEPNFQTWADNVRKAVELDKRTIQGLTEVLDWSQQDEFWQTNILSTKKLREKYDTLKIQMGRNTYNQAPKSSLGFTDDAPSDPNDVIYSDETIEHVSRLIDKGQFTPKAEDIPKINEWRIKNGIKELDQYAKN